MTGLVRSTIDAAVILPLISLFLLMSTTTLVEYAISRIPRPPGIWAYRPAVQFPPDAMVPPPWEDKLEEGELEPGTPLAVPIWNQNRSGDLLVALILSLILPWIVSQLWNPFPVKLMSVFGSRLSQF
jgi:hypothetical protein